MALSADSISRQHRKDLQHLKRRGSWVRLIIASALALSIFVPGVLWWSEVAGPGGGSARQALFLSGGGWARDLLQTQSEYREWLRFVALPIEVRLFDALSEALFYSARVIGGDRVDLSFASSVFVSIHFALLRLAFILVCCWKLWLLALGVGVYLSRDRWRSYTADDMLGQTGNGRIYYSGVRVALEKLDSDGRPDAQIVGLACVPFVSEEEAKASPLYQALVRFDALTQTNLRLAATILKFPHYPAYVADRLETGKLEQVFSGATLPDHATALLSAMLATHASFSEESQGGDRVDGPIPSDRCDSTEYAHRVAHAARRVLTPHFQEELAALPSAHLATMILALEAGKILAYGYEGEKWLRKSNFPQLSARAVLHSVPSFAKEYECSDRTLIRQAIIFGSRRSVFAPVRLPQDMHPQTRALRQWAELLLAIPHELSSVTDEVELLGMVYETHYRWQEGFFEGITQQRPELCLGAYSTPSNLALFPLRAVLRSLRASIDQSDLARLEVLVQAVSQKQRLDLLASDNAAEAASLSRAVREQVVAPLSYQETKDLAAEHSIDGASLTTADLKDWSTLRVVLQMYGWLARRVGDYTVPPSSLILVAIRPEEVTKECNDLGLLSRRGIVPLRATRLAEHFGKQWHVQLERAQRARMAVTFEQLERLMRGAQDESLGDEAETGPGSGPPIPPRGY